MWSVSFLVLLVTGLGLTIPGLYLMSLGGSRYYTIAGLLTLVSAVLVLYRRSLGIHLFWLIFLGSVVWAIWEVGLDGWALMPRLVFLAIISLWLVLPAISTGVKRGATRFGLAALLATLLGLSWAIAISSLRHGSATLALAQPVSAVRNPIGDWEYYGNSVHGTRFSQLAQITPANVGRLQQAWVYHTGLQNPRGDNLLELTPLMVGHRLYGCTGYGAVFALDPISGRQIWRYQAKIDVKVAGRAVCRGVAYFRAPSGVIDCPTRILLGTVDNKLLALDADTGKPCRSFGNNGQVNLAENEGLERFPPGWINPTSPPTIVRATAVIGSYIIDDQSTVAPPGVIRGYDAVTGRLKWAFDPGRPNDQTPLGAGQSYTASTPNSWPVFSADENLGLVYLPMGNGSPDFYGVLRTPQTDHFSSAVVALDADTGRPRWSFQAVHHDLWDYDLAAQPVLVDFPANGKTIPALIQATKTGQIFVLDRRSGVPILPVVERGVPASSIPKERASRTQPFSVQMPDFEGPALREADMWGITPFDQLYCRIKFRRARYEGIYTAPGLGPSIRMPGELGGIDWGSVSVDESRDILVVNSNLMADYDQFISRARADRDHLFPKGSARAKATSARPPAGAAMAGTPYGVLWDPFLTPLGIPCQRPPYGYLSAVDLRTHHILWQRRLGNASNSGPFDIALGLPFQLGAPNIGGSIVTQGGIIFIAASQDQYFRAVDEASGRVLWQVRLPAGGHATPMTYLGRDGKQYVVIAAGGERSFHTQTGDDLIAYRLN